METKKLKIALCGASGSGKSTLARFISSKYGLPYKENSAGLLLPEEDQDYLVKTFGWTKSGHADVIRLSNINPSFGFEFQLRLMRARKKFIEENDSFIIDRSPVDNVAYFLLQTSHLVPQDMTARFIQEAIEGSYSLDKLIILDTMDIGQVEDNGSRIASFPYQKMVTEVFHHVANTYFNHLHFRVISTANFSERQLIIENFLK